MKQQFLIKVFFCLTLIFGASLLNANAQGSVNISGELGNGKLQKGKTATAVIVMDIPGDLHVNSARPLSQYAIPTKIKATGAGVKIGAVAYPKGTTKKFSFSDEQIAVYEGRTTFRVPVTVPANFKGNVARINIVVNYQSCSNEVCYRPRTGEVTLSAAVK